MVLEDVVELLLLIVENTGLEVALGVDETEDDTWELLVVEGAMLEVELGIDEVEEDCMELLVVEDAVLEIALELEIGEAEEDVMEELDEAHDEVGLLEAGDEVGDAL